MFNCIMEKSQEDHVSGERTVEPSRSKSCDTACSSNSSCFFRKRKPLNPLAGSLIHMNTSRRNTGNAVKQRVLSAKVLKLKSVQNQLNDANHHLAELMRENQALKTLQKRQDKALSKYEGTNAELPRLLKSHEEEIRVLNERNKVLRRQIRDLNDQIKIKSDELQATQSKLKHLEKLDKDKNLLEREKLTEQCDNYKDRLQKVESQVSILNRKLILEEKGSKQRLNSEIIKHKQCQRELSQALVEIDKISKHLEVKNRKLINKNHKFNFSRQSSENLNNNNSGGTMKRLSSLEKSPVTEVRLVPIKIVNKGEESSSTSILATPPSDNVKARLSKEIVDEIPQVNSKSRPNSSIRLEKLTQNVENTMKKAESHSADKRLGDYCLQAISSVNNCNEIIGNHNQDLDYAKSDTEKLISTLKEIDEIDSKLKHSHLISFDSKSIHGTTSEDSLDLVGQILKEELEFKRKYGSDKNSGNGEGSSSSLSFARKSVEINNEKTKLLATLRAIDNGDSVDSLDGLPQRKTKLIQELFGDID